MINEVLQWLAIGLTIAALTTPKIVRVWRDFKEEDRYE